MTSQFEDAFELLSTGLKGFESTDVVHVVSGMSIGGHSSHTDLDVGAASSLYARFVQSEREALRQFGREDAPMEDLLISTDRRYTLIRPLPDTSYAHILIVSREASLGLCRTLMKKTAPALIEAVS